MSSMTSYLCWGAVALAFEAQLVESVPVEPHDRGVDIVVTAHDMLCCSPRSQQLLKDGGAAGEVATRLP